MRTTEPRHKKAVAALWVFKASHISSECMCILTVHAQKVLEEKGYIYKGKHEGWYAVSDEAFYADNQVQEIQDPKTGEKMMVIDSTTSWQQNVSQIQNIIGCYRVWQKGGMDRRGEL